MIVHGEATAPIQEVHGVTQVLLEPLIAVLHGEETHGTMVTAIAEEELLHGATIIQVHAVAGRHQVIRIPVSVAEVVAAVQVAAVPVAEVVDHAADINRF